MADKNNQLLSRRNWLGLTTPALAASLGAGLLARNSRAAEPGAAAAVAADGLAGARVYNVRSYGAKGDGQTLDTAAVQAAIDACNGDQGGTVLVPAGDFLVGTIELKSNVTLHLAPRGRLLGSTAIDHYSAGKGIPPGNGNFVLLYAANAENIAIEGTGTIDGQGRSFLEGAKDDGERTPGRRRAHLAIFYRCRQLSLRDVFLRDSAYHCCRILQCSFVVADGVRIHTRVIFNNDGFHLNSCEHVKISNCNVVCEDDACALFGGNRDVTVTNCTFSSRWSVFRFGGGTAENITVSNCVIYDTFGCPIKAQVRSGNRLENILFSNLVMKNVTGPIYLGLGSVPRNSMNPNETQPGGVIRNIMFRGIEATVAAAPDLANFPYLPGTPISDIYPGEHRTCIDLTSVPGQYIENVVLSDIHVTFAGGGTAREAALRDVPQVSGAEYFGLGVLPAYAVYARNVRGLRLNDVRFEVATPDLRPALVFDHVEDAALNGFSAQGNPGAESLLRFIESSAVLLSATRVLTPAAVFLRVEGPASAGLKIDGGDLSRAATLLSFGNGADEKAVTVRGE
jgi:Glycosyl hydrolases family 28